MTTNSLSHLCPVCHKPNQCTNIQANTSSDCWCNKESIPQGLLDMIPQNQQMKACVCTQCIALFKKQASEAKLFTTTT
jgi:hypothetical protein